MLTGVKKLFLNNCSKIVDVGMLHNLDVLCISNCKNLVDVSMLSNKCEISLNGCNAKITNIGSLTNIKYD